MRPETFMHVAVGGGTVTLSIGVDEKDDGFHTAVGVSFCSPRDHFVKAKGRLISERRRNSDSAYRFTTVIPKSEKIKDAVFQMFISRCAGRFFSPDRGIIPSWARKAALHGWY